MNYSSLNHLSLVPTRKGKRAAHDNKSTDFSANPMSNSIAMMMIYHPYPLSTSHSDVTDPQRK